MKRILIAFISVFIWAVTMAQVDVDRSINLTGGVGQSRITGLLDVPSDDAEAANKKYVDDQIASIAGSGGRFLGELFGGGVVFSVSKNANGEEHGLVVSLIDNHSGSGIPWSNVTSLAVGGAARSSWNGQANTSAIIAQNGHSASAAKVCSEYNGGGFNDWYLPASDQLDKLWTNRVEVFQTLADIPGGILPSGKDQFDNLLYYWSSTEAYPSYAERMNFSINTSGASWHFTAEFKTSSMKVRCIRTF